MRFVCPSIMIAVSICTAIVYAFDGDWRRTIYWAAASALTAAVTF